MANLDQDILQLIQDSNGHLSAERIFLLAKEKQISISMASTYRVLAKLVLDGKIRKIKTTEDSDLYDKNVMDHAHLICSVCGKVTDIHVTNFREILENMIKMKNFDSYDLCINYVCEDCQKRMKELNIPNNENKEEQK